MRLATDGAQMNTDEAGWNAITERVIGCAYKVAGKMGCGFLEKCYENALAHEMKKSGLAFQQQVRLDVWYDDEVIVGEYVADFIVEGSILVELKAIQALESIHTAQCINYLAATKLPICLLINFGKRVEVKRVVGSTFKNSNRSPS
jgi:GxxExxY protein